MKVVYIVLLIILIVILSGGLYIHIGIDEDQDYGYCSRNGKCEKARSYHECSSIDHFNTRDDCESFINPFKPINPIHPINPPLVNSPACYTSSYQNNTHITKCDTMSERDCDDKQGRYFNTVQECQEFANKNK